MVTKERGSGEVDYFAKLNLKFQGCIFCMGFPIKGREGWGGGDKMKK